MDSWVHRVSGAPYKKTPRTPLERRLGENQRHTTREKSPLHSQDVEVE
jgi:hypothetical protein